MKALIKTEQQVEHLKNKGITFSYCSESDAADYLRDNNNFFKLTSYRKNYEKYENPEKAGKYINLDFAYLKDLAIIDMSLRYTLVQLALDIEHFAKLKLLRKIEEKAEDGYEICNDFFQEIAEDQASRLTKEILINKNSIYCCDLIEKYSENIPVWVFLELISFGRLVNFYKFCAERFEENKMKNEVYMLLSCKEIRNAAAHSQCILNDLKLNTKKHDPDWKMMKEIYKIPSVSKDVAKNRMSNERVRQIVTLLYTHKSIVTSAGVLEKAHKSLYGFQERMMKNISFYNTNDLIRGTFNFLDLIIDNWQQSK